MGTTLFGSGFFRSSVGGFELSDLGSKYKLGLFGDKGITVYGGQVATQEDQSGNGIDFAQAGGDAAKPLSNGAKTVTYDGVGEFQQSDANVAYFSAMTTGSISWIGQVNSEDRLGTLEMTNSADNTEYFAVGINATNKMQIEVRYGSDRDKLESTTAVSDGDRCQIVSSGSAITMFINGVSDTVVVLLGSNQGAWMDAPTVDRVTLGAFRGTVNVFYPQEDKALIITEGEDATDLSNIENYLNSNYS